MTSAAKTNQPVVYTIPELRANLDNFFNQTVRPGVRDMVNTNAQKFGPESINVISYELAAASNTLNHYGMYSPLKEWMFFAFDNIKPLVDVPDQIDDMILNDSIISDQTDKAMVELNAIIETIFSKAQQMDCPQLISNMNDYTRDVMTNISNALAFMKTGLAADTTTELSLMKSTYLDFHNNITDCSQLRPLSVCKSCMLNLVRSS